MRDARWLLLPLLALTVILYLPGLQGPFMFDDTAHITRNSQVHIQDLSADSLARAWSSSLADFPSSRPLAQLSFGIDHALSGLDSRAFKTTNLLIHLLVGLLVFALTRQLTRAYAYGGGRDPGLDSPWPALLTTALWLLHPLNLSPVLYVIQRMTSLSALFVLAGLWCHVSGRWRMSQGSRGGFWLALAGLPLAGIGVLAKESAALYPLLVLVLEWTLLRELGGRRRRLLIGLVGLLPLLLGLAYLLTHLQLITYVGREFTLEQRLLSETRILWLYLGLFLLPDLGALGFYHDDIATSLALLAPWTTLPATLGWLLVLVAAVTLARRWPVAAFAALFFLAGHAMESTIFPLELVFEHRNYLPILGPAFAIGWLLARPYEPRRQRALGLLALVVLTGLSLLTNLRARDWSTEDRLLITEVRHHPDSPRANFRIAQKLMDQVGQSPQANAAYRAALFHLERTRQLDPDNHNALFGQLFLSLFVRQDPEPELVDTLVKQLRDRPAGPTKLAISQFAFLVRWQATPGLHKLSDAQALAILTAVLNNRTLNATGRAGVLSSVASYHLRVRKDPVTALRYARQAVRTWPGRWHYRYYLVRLLIMLDRPEEARQALDKARQIKSARLNSDQLRELEQMLASMEPRTPKHD